MAKITIEEKSVDELPEVKEFQQAKYMLEQFRAQNPQFFEAYDRFIDDYNQKLQAADKVVRAHQVKCGDWDLYQQYTVYDATKLCELLGEERFMDIGGTIQQQKKYSVDNKSLEMAVAQNKVAKDIMDLCTTVTSKYHAPKKIGT